MFQYFIDLFFGGIIGFVEGVTEFLPISSTAHMYIVGDLISGGKGFSSELGNIIQFGAIVAVIQFYFADLKDYFARLMQLIKSKIVRQEFGSHITSWWKNKSSEETANYRIDVTLVQLVIATIPVGLAGLLLRKFVENFRTTHGIALFLILGAILMAAAQWFYNKQKSHYSGILTPIQTTIVGLFQVLAIFGGVSRSGATLSGAYFLGLDKRTSVKLIFLLSIPALVLAALKDSVSVVANIKNYHFLPTADVLTTGNISLLGVLFGSVIAYFTALASLRWLLNYLSKNSFLPFVVYRIVLGLALLLIF